MRYIISLFFLLIVIPVYAKRIPPPIVPDVEYNGVRYTAPNHDGRIAIVKAIDIQTGKPIWTTPVFQNHIKPRLEEDVQWVFIANLKVAQKELIITDERGRNYHIDLSTGQVQNSIFIWVIAAIATILVFVIVVFKRKY